MRDYGHAEHHITFAGFISVLVGSPTILTDSESNSFYSLNHTCNVFAQFLLISAGIHECCFCCNITLYRQVRQNQRLRYRIYSTIIVMMFLSVYTLAVYIWVYLYIHLRYYNIPEQIVLDSMTQSMNNYPSDKEKAKSWNTLQSRYECCGIHNYTDWYTVLHNTVPDTCCKVCNPGCGKNVSVPVKFYPNGCLNYTITFINDQVLLQTITHQTICLFIIVFSFCSGLLITYLSIKEYFAEMECCKPQNRLNANVRESQENLLENNIEENNDEPVPNMNHNVDEPEQNNEINEDNHVINVDVQVNENNIR